MQYASVRKQRSFTPGIKLRAPTPRQAERVLPIGSQTSSNDVRSQRHRLIVGVQLVAQQRLCDVLYD